MKKVMISLALVVLVVASMIPFALAQETTAENDLQSLLPQGIGYKWIYNGFAEYGHTMSITGITSDKTGYRLSGLVDDMSGMQSVEALSFTMMYVIVKDALVQYTGAKIQDSDFSRIELIRAPLAVGNTWTQELISDAGELVNLNCKIVALDTENGLKIYTVHYDSINGDYYEIRKIKENVGVISFEKPIKLADTVITMTYFLYEEMSGYMSFLPFKDLDSNSWYAQYVNTVILADILHGYPDLTIRPNDTIRVSEFMAMLLNSMGYEAPAGNAVWYSNYLAKAKALNIIKDGDYDNYDRPINRQEMAKMVVLAANAVEITGSSGFADNNIIGTKYLGYVNAAVSLGILTGYSDNTFRPSNSLTRAEASSVTVNVMGMK